MAHLFNIIGRELFSVLQSKNNRSFMAHILGGNNLMQVNLNHRMKYL